MKSKHFDSNNITVIDENQADLGMLELIKEEAVIYIVKPEKKIFNVIIQMHLVLKAIRQNLVENIVFIPGENHDIIEYMIENNALNDFNIETLNFDLIPIDIDLLSLEKDNTIKEIYIDKNYTTISDFASAFVKMETCFGKVKNKYIKGDLAQAFCNIVEEKEIETNLKTNEEILGMIVLDRSVDFITLMTTNYTCEGLLDDKLGINLGRIKIQEKIIKENLTKEPVTSEKLIPYGLTTINNPFYCSFRCMYYLDAYNYINRIKDYYTNLALMYKDNAGNNKLSLNKLNEVTKELNYYNSLKDNLTMSENIINYIVQPIKDPNYLKYKEKEQLMLAGDLPDNLYSFYDEHLCEQRDLTSLIKLMILESLTQSGIKDYQKLKREILNIYGYQNIFLFRDLESLGWLKEKEILKNLKKLIDVTYSQINEKLELIKLNDQKKVDDCSYLLGGYCPLSLRIIEIAIEGRWGKYADILKKMPGVTSYPDDESVISNPKAERNIIFIVFVGGITYTEIEGIRYLNRKFNEEYKNKKRKKRTQFIILTTGILNSKKIFGNLGKEIHSSLTMKQFYEQNQK